jgi:hypothetical protein
MHACAFSAASRMQGHKMTMRALLVLSPSLGPGYTSICLDDRFTCSHIAPDRSFIQVLPIIPLHKAVLSFNKPFCSSIRSLSLPIELLKFGQRNSDATPAIAPYGGLYRPCWRHGYRPAIHGRISCTVPSSYPGFILIYLAHTIRGSTPNRYCHSRARAPRSRHCTSSNAPRRSRVDAVGCTAPFSDWPCLSDRR